MCEPEYFTNYNATASFDVQAAKELGYYGYYTGPYAKDFETNPEAAVAPYVEAAKAAHNCGLGVNAGHDLNLKNLKYFKQHVGYLNEVSIGHSLIADALYMGLEKTIKAYKECLNGK